MNFFEKLTAAGRRNHSLLCVGLDPRPEQLPERYRFADDPLLAWNLDIIAQTADFAAAYKPNIAFYEALGRRGYDLLEATMGAVPPDIPVIMDAKRGDIGSTAAAYATAIFDRWGADAVTLSPYLGLDSVEPFAAYTDRGLFLLTHTSNPGAAALQERPTPTQPLYLRLAASLADWSAHGNIGLVVGATFPAAIARVRAVAPEAWFLIPGVGAQGGDLEAAVRAGLRADGAGVLINVSRGISLAEEMGATADRLRRRINAAVAAGPVAPPDPARELIGTLIDLEAIRFGDFLLASGKRSPIYIDLRRVIGSPSAMRRLANIYAGLLASLTADRLAAVPYGALPIAAVASQATGLPLIYPRKQAKAHGLRRPVEGIYQAGERVVLVEDLVTSGGSVLDAAETLRTAGLAVSDAVVFLDRLSGARERLAEAGIRLHAALDMDQLLETLSAMGKISAAQRDALRGNR